MKGFVTADDAALERPARNEPIAVSPDGRYLAFVDPADALALWQIDRAPTQVATLPFTGPFAVRDDGTVIAVAPATRRLVEVAPATARVVRDLGVTWPAAVAVAGDVVATAQALDREDRASELVVWPRGTSAPPVRVRVDGTQLDAALVRKPSRASPQWQPRQLGSSAAVRDFAAELKKALRDWGDRDE